MRAALIDGLVDEAECPVTHRWAHGLYIRETFMPAGALVVSKIHRYNNPAFIVQGRALVKSETEQHIVQAGDRFITPAGTKRALYMLEDTVWVTVHPNPDNERDLDKIEARLIAASFEELEIQLCLG